MGMDIKFLAFISQSVQMYNKFNLIVELISFFMIIRTIVIFNVYTRAADAWGNYATTYLSNLALKIGWDDGHDWALFVKRFKALPTRVNMLFSFHKWTYKQLTGTYEDDLSKIYQELINV